MYKGIHYNEYRIYSEMRSRSVAADIDYTIVRSRYDFSLKETKYSITTGHYLQSSQPLTFILDDKQIYLELNNDGFAYSSNKNFRYTSFLIETEKINPEYYNKHLYYVLVHMKVTNGNFSRPTAIDIPSIGIDKEDALNNLKQHIGVGFSLGTSPVIWSAEPNDD